MCRPRGQRLRHPFPTDSRIGRPRHTHQVNLASVLTLAVCGHNAVPAAIPVVPRLAHAAPLCSPAAVLGEVLVDLGAAPLAPAGRMGLEPKFSARAGCARERCPWVGT